MPHVMLDLETLGTRPGCSILSIGAVEFDAHSGKLGKEFYEVVSRASCRAKGLEEDASTIEWWSKQNREAQKVLEDAETCKQGLGGALIQFTRYLEPFGKRNLYVWGCGADFDQPIIAACYAKVSFPLPWLFYNNRCYRTLRALGKVKGDAPARTGVYHNALDDAKTQALQAINIIRAMGITI